MSFGAHDALPVKDLSLVGVVAPSLLLFKLELREGL